MSLVRNATPSILLSRNLCFSKHLGKSVEVSMMVMGNFEIRKKLNSICYFSHFLQVQSKVSKVRKRIKVGIVNEFHTYIHGVKYWYTVISEWYK